MSKKVHFIAIGGSIMHNLAIALHKKGYEVSGSDDQIFDPSKSRLDKYGLCPKVFGWDENNIHSGLDEVILGMHAKPDNPELLKAQELGLNVYSFPEYIYKESKNKQRIVICGSHGKTTITSMVMHVLNFWNRSFDYAVGAQLDGFETMVKLTHESPIIIIEGDEYLSSPIDRTPKFIRYQHHICSISGIAWDHINVFPTEENYNQQFRSLSEKTPRSGSIIYNTEDELVKKIVEENNSDVLKFPYKTPKHSIKGGITYLKINKKEVPLQVFGKHNLSNLSCAHNICSRISITDDQFLEAISSYAGANKRLNVISNNNDTHVFLDFAHAPSKLKATVDAVSEQFNSRKLTAIFELHTFSSLNKEFITQYSNTLKSCDTPAVFIDPKVLKKKGIGQISEQEIHNYFNDNRIKLLSSNEEIKEFVNQKDWDNNNLLLMSSGNFDGLDIKELAQSITNN